MSDRASKTVRAMETKARIEAATVKAHATIMAALPHLVAELSDAEWAKLKREEDRRRFGR
jgi:hypothetical protein